MVIGLCGNKTHDARDWDPRAIAGQILRHRSYTYQGFPAVCWFHPCWWNSSAKTSRQDTKNRQNSIDDIDDFKNNAEIAMKRYFENVDICKTMLDAGIAKGAKNGASTRHAYQNLHDEQNIAPSDISLEAQWTRHTWILLIKQKQLL